MLNTVSTLHPEGRWQSSPVPFRNAPPLDVLVPPELPAAQSPQWRCPMGCVRRCVTPWWWWLATEAMAITAAAVTATQEVPLQGRGDAMR